MKLWTNSSIQTCQARLVRGTGAFLFDSVGLGEGSGVGDDLSAVGEGEGEGDGDGEDDGIGDGEAMRIGGEVCCGVGDGAIGTTTSGFFCERKTANAIRRTATTTAAITKSFHRGAAFLPSTGAVCFIAVSPPGFSLDGPSNSLIAEATAGTCFETGWESASSQCGVLR